MSLNQNLSIIIRNRNEAEFIGFSLQSCSDFFTRPEVIIVDNDSSDESLEIISLFEDSNRLDIKKLKVDSYSPGKSINHAVQNASNDYILILSGHCQISNLKLNVIENELENNSAVFGKQVPIYKGKKIVPRYIWSHFKNEREINMFSEIEDRYFLHNGFCFYKRDVLLKYPFDEKLRGKEDRYWAIEMVNKGYNFVYNPELVCNHFYTLNGATWKGMG